MLKLKNYSLVEFTLRRRTRLVPYWSIQWATSSIYLLHCSISLCSQSWHQRFMSLWSTLTTYDGLEFDLLPIPHYKKKTFRFALIGLVAHISHRLNPYGQYLPGNLRYTFCSSLCLTTARFPFACISLRTNSYCISLFIPSTHFGTSSQYNGPAPHRGHWDVYTSVPSNTIIISANINCQYSLLWKRSKYITCQLRELHSIKIISHDTYTCYLQ